MAVERQTLHALVVSDGAGAVDDGGSAIAGRPASCGRTTAEVARRRLKAASRMGALLDGKK